MNEQVNQLVMNADLASMPEAGLDPAAEQLQRKQRLAAALRIFGKFGFDEGVAGHITVRDPIDTETFWVNPCLLYTSPSPRDRQKSRMPSSA